MKKPGLFRLLLNHVDAWQVSFVIATLAVLLHGQITTRHVILLLAIAAGYWLAFTLNDYHDAPYDALDQAKRHRNFFVRHPLTRRQALVFFSLSLLALLVIFSRFGWRGWLVMGISIFIMWAYSSPPLRFKSRPGIDLLVHALFVETYPYLITLYLMGVSWLPADYVILTITFLASLTAQLEQQLRDFVVDRRTGSTFVTTVGRQRAALLLKALSAILILTTVVYLLNGTLPLFVLPIGVIAMPAILHRFLRQEDIPRSERLVIISTTAGFVYTLGVFLYFAFM
ncbi:MAG: UbiA family prenyltransferase [Ardenticatenales bacterium]|nr:UbiA family prenyltransferase [Ardenticatenales bacterium]